MEESCQGSRPVTDMKRCLTLTQQQFAIMQAVESACCGPATSLPLTPV